MMPWLLSTIFEWDFLALIYVLSVCRCWRFVLDPIAAEASLTFAWCTWFFSRDGFFHGVWRWLHLEDSQGSW